MRGAIIGDKALLPASLLHTRDETGRSHLTELDTRDTELAHVALRTTRHAAAVVQTYGRSVLRQSLKCLVVTFGLELSTLGSILSDELRTLYLACLH